MEPIIYHPIGVVISPLKETLKPEAMRGITAQLVLNHQLIPVARTLRAGNHIWVIYHLHHAKPISGHFPLDLFKRRITTRPNAIAVTLVQVISAEDETITVVGLDAIDGSPILDIKPYQTIWDAPPVIPQKSKNTQRPIIALTGGPGGGKSSLIEDLHHDPVWTGCFVALPEAVQYARLMGISPGEKLFQRAIVHLQIGLENGLDQALGYTDPRPIICHRGSLDPLAFWRLRGWDPDEFYTLVGLSRQEHNQRYAGVIHLVTTADGAPSEYIRWPQSHRPEEASQAIQLDRWLAEAWSNHPQYYRLDNRNQDWAAKSQAARTILAKLVGR